MMVNDAGRIACEAWEWLSDTIFGVTYEEAV